MLRLFLLFGLFGALSLSALVFEAASSNAAARDLLEGSRALEGSTLHSQVLERASRQLENSWAKPAEWNSDAAETLSAIYAAQARAAVDVRALLSKSIAAASRAVALSPVQPQTWTRLAAFAQMGLPDVPCTVTVCLEMSWRAGPMTEPETACIRLHIAHAEGLLTSPEDPRVQWYLRSGASRAEIVECLDFFPRDTAKSLMELCEADLRCLDAHSHLGNFVFDHRPQDSIRHYEVGLRIGELSLGDDFNGVLPWGFLDNRPFLRCMHGFGLCLWLLGRFEEAERVFDRMLWLSPSDNQGVRFLIDKLRSKTAWEDRSEVR